MARLIPTCPQCGGNVTLNPAHEWVTCSFCRATSFIETPARRNAPNHPPPHVQVIHLSPEQVKRSVNLTLFILLVTALPPILIVVALARPWQLWTSNGSSSSNDDSTPAAAAAPPRAPGNYFVDATPLRPLLQQELGPQAQILSLHLSGGASAQVDLPTSPRMDAFDTLWLNDGKKWRREPMLIPPRDSEVGSRVLTIPQVELAMVPKLIAEAQSRLNIPGGKVVHVRLDTPPPLPISAERRARMRPDPSATAPRWTVLIRNERHTQGTVSFDLQGRFMKMTGP